LRQSVGVFPDLAKFGAVFLMPQANESERSQNSVVATPEKLAAIGFEPILKLGLARVRAYNAIFVRSWRN
jgi:hypothetical protein